MWSIIPFPVCTILNEFAVYLINVRPMDQKCLDISETICRNEVGPKKTSILSIILFLTSASSNWRVFTEKINNEIKGSSV
jgi:hypothetical protein